MRYVFGFLCVCALGVLPLVGCGGIESESCGTGGPGWFSQCSPTSYVLNDVSFTDANTGTAVGGGGTILRTTDGGVTWVEQNSGTTETLRSVSFVDASTGTAVGESGTILRTTDGGATWVTQQSFLPPIPDLDRDLLDVSFIDANAGMAVGRAGRTWDGLTRGICLWTTDGGATWWLLDVPARRDFTGVSITDAHVTIIGGDFIVRINAGDIIPFDTVKAQVLQFRDEDLFDVSFTDANTGTAVGIEGTILRTTDGGGD